MPPSARSSRVQSSRTALVESTDHGVYVYAAVGQESAVLRVWCAAEEWGRAGLQRPTAAAHEGILCRAHKIIL